MPDPITDHDLEQEFGDLLAAVRAERPEMDGAFRAQLDERIARPPKRELRSLRPSPALLGGLATAAAAVAVAVPVALDAARDDTTGPTPTPSTSIITPAAKSAAGSAGATESVAPAEPSAVAPEPLPPSDDGRLLPNRRSRSVERSASVTLSAPSDEIEKVADDVIRVTDEVGGIVVTSNVTSADDSLGRATFDLRIPTARLQTFLRELSDVAHVKARSQAATDVTRAVVSAGERLADARAERKALLRALAKADTANETASLRTRLRITAAEIAAARAGVRTLRERTSFSVVSVSVESDTSPSAGRHDDGKWTPADAWRDAKRVLEVLAGIALVGLAVALPAALLGGLVWLGIRRATRRRRERVLDEA